MKSIQTIFSISLVLLLFVSCEKDNELNDNPTFTGGSDNSGKVLKGQFDGSEVSFTSVNVVKNSGLEALSGNTSTQSISISYPTNPNVNSPYDIDGVQVSVTYISDISSPSNKTYAAQSGTFNVSLYNANNSIIEGTFSAVLFNTGNASDSIVVTAGSFKH